MNTSFTYVCNDYAKWLDTLGFAASVLYNHQCYAKYFFEYLHTKKNVTALNAITQSHVYSYFEYLQQRKNKKRKGTLSTPSLNCIFAAIDKLCEYLNQMGVTAAPSPTNFRIAEDKLAAINKIQPFTIDEIKTLQSNIINTYSDAPFKQREAIHEDLKLIFALYYGCGLRRSEGYKLTANDIDFDKKTIFVQQGKNYKDRIVPMSAAVCKVVENYVYNYRNLLKLKHNRLFISTTKTMTEHLKKLQAITNCNAIQSKRLSLHILRHSIATHLLQKGMSMEQIGRFLGHSSLNTTQLYTHLI